MKRVKWLLFLLVFLPIVGFPQLKEPSFPGQDPLVEEAIRTLVNSWKTDRFWDAWVKMRNLAKMAKNPESQALISWLRTWVPRPFEDEPSYVFKNCYAPHLLSPDEGPGLPEPPKKDFRAFFYDPFYIPYLKESGLYQEAIERFQNGTFEEFYEELRKKFDEEEYECFMKAEEYDPDLTIAWYYYRDTGRVYYDTTRKTSREAREWRRYIESYELERRLEAIKGELSEWEKEDLSRKLRREASLYESEYSTTYLLEWLAKLYAQRGELEKAIYYAEWHLSREDPVMVAYTPPAETADLEKVKEWRTSYLRELKAKGEEDKLPPLIIGEKPLNPKFSLTKEGTPYVAVLPFCQALNVSAEWTREGKLLTIKIGETLIRIANLKGKWWIYKEGERKDVDAYLKDKELFLPLQELCQLLSLKLDWDEETYIARVSGE